jgi:predicted P-loop ATPase
VRAKETGHPRSVEYEFEGKPLDLNHIKSFISQNLGYDSSTENCIQAVHAIASKFAFHPVRDYLEALRDSPLVDYQVFDNLATLFLGNSDPLANRMLAKTLIGAVARVKKPDTKVDTLIENLERGRDPATTHPIPFPKPDR